MRRYRMNDFLSISIAVLLFSGCGLGSYKHLEKTDSTRADVTSIFDTDATSYIFKSKLQYADNKLGGLLLVKLLEDGSIRLTLTPQVGPKIFDFEFTAANKFVMHYCIQQMNRPIVLRMIENDLRLLFVNSESVKTKSWRQLPDKKSLVQKIKTNKSVNYYFLDGKTGNLATLESASGLGRKKVVVTLEDYDDDFPKKIALVHQNIPLSLQFSVIKRK